MHEYPFDLRLYLTLFVMESRFEKLTNKHTHTTKTFGNISGIHSSVMYQHTDSASVHYILYVEIQWYPFSSLLRFKYTVRSF